MTDKLKFVAKEITEPYIIEPFEVPTTEAYKYIGQGKDWSPPDGTRVFPYLPVCPNLLGKPWNDAALAFISTVNPSRIRVITWSMGQNSDSYGGRVTVTLDPKGNIAAVNMECVAWVPKEIESAYHLFHVLRSPDKPFQAGAMLFCNPGAISKVQFDSPTIKENDQTEKGPGTIEEKPGALAGK